MFLANVYQRDMLYIFLHYLLLARTSQIVIQKIERGVLLFPLFLPLLETLNTCYNSLLIQSIAEGATFTNRLQGLVEQKVRFV